MFLSFIYLVIFERESSSVKQTSTKHFCCLSLSNADITGMSHDILQGLQTSENLIYLIVPFRKVT